LVNKSFITDKCNSIEAIRLNCKIFEFCIQISQELQRFALLG
jgi:hypothetical protein